MKILRTRMRRRHIDKAERWQTLLVIGLCILTLVAIFFGMRYDKSRWVQPAALTTNSLYDSASFETDTAFAISIRLAS
ncbi:hypothetical protein CHR55_32830 [Rhodococcus qingshengii]|uniref:Uncharacterized protein n=1 Tax=Rhodococcus qingshengii TaxID=334542 RepID=A0A2A5IY05_RHOSG|nr:hypothetical protein CHR55_32830 [Rhodococcus qingshengii]